MVKDEAWADKLASSTEQHSRALQDMHYWNSFSNALTAQKPVSTDSSGVHTGLLTSDEKAQLGDIEAQEANHANELHAAASSIVAFIR